jgi:hypothetical protein
MRKILCLAALLSVSACATGPGLQSRMAAYTGASAETLVKDLGVPDKQITLDGVQYFAYDQHHILVSPGFYAFGSYSPFYDGPFYNAGFPPTVTEAGCETTFALRDNKVVSFTLRGNDCS